MSAHNLQLFLMCSHTLNDLNHEIGYFSVKFSIKSLLVCEECVPLHRQKEIRHS